MDDLARRTFLRVVETGSLSAAAKALETDVSTVSRRISGFEATLGVQLFDRKQRKTEPTGAGLKLYEGLRRLVDEQDALEAEVRGEADIPRGLLRVACPTNLGELHLTRWTVEFQAHHPELSIELLLDDRYVDLRGAGVDVAIRIGALSDSALTARRIGAMQLGLFASPRFLADKSIETPEDLMGCPFVLFSFLQAGDQLSLTGENAAKARVSMSSRLSINNIGAISRAIELDVGIHAGPLWLFAPLEAKGSVRRVLPEWSPPLYPVHAVHNYGRRAPAKVRQFVDHLSVELSKLDGIVR